MGGNDFVNVRLTDFGTAIAAGGTVKVHEGNHSFYVAPGETLRVTRAFEWERVLKLQQVNGRPLFEIVEEKVSTTEGADERKEPQRKPKLKGSDANENS
jgi:hypothetical protein